jgi:hypothetical protein
MISEKHYKPPKELRISKKLNNNSKILKSKSKYSNKIDRTTKEYWLRNLLYIYLNQGL